MHGVNGASTSTTLSDWYESHPPHKAEAELSTKRKCSAYWMLLRRGELLGLRWEHIDFSNRVAHLPVTKNGEGRYVPLSSRAVAILEGLPRGLSGQVFPIKPQTVAAAFMKATDRAGLGDVRFHDLRHTATTALANKLPNLIELSSVSGHKSLSMLKKYYHPSASELAKKIG